jgi:hypothetical protein
MQPVLPHTAYPDLAYIRKSVPIRAVAEQLDLAVKGRMVHCWRPQNHQHGDRTPSVGLQERYNIAKCFVCDTRALSPIDLVMSVLAVDLRRAVQWITSHFKVPPARKGRHIQHQERWSEVFRVGTSGTALEMLVRSGIWASLSPAQRSIIPVLETFADPQTHKVTISYRGMMRYAGIRSQSTVSTGLKRFQTLHFLRVERRWESDGLRACNTYHLCFDDPEFVEHANQHLLQQRDLIENERKLRRQARNQRRQTRVLPVNTLSND